MSPTRRTIPPTRSGKIIAALMAEYRVRPNRLRGQHFLIDDEVYEAMVSTAKLSERDTVVEIGSGLGTLTELLADVAREVIGVEVDEKLARILKHRFVKRENIEIIHDDILSTAVAEITSEPYHVVANVPYYLTGALFRKFLAEDRQPLTMTVLIQREVAKRLTAKPGNFSLAALGAQLYGTPTLVRTVPPTSFFPPPEVESAVLTIQDIHPFPFTDVPEKFFWRVARVGFASPRKQLRNNFQAGFRELSAEVLEKIFSESGVPSSRRAQDLTIEDWHRLAVQLVRVATAS